MTAPRSGSAAPARTAGWALLPVVLSLVYSTAFVARTSFEFDGRRQFCLADDALISLTYARNCAEGRGLRWNHDVEPPVEGITNPGWTLLLVPLHRFGWSPPAVALAVQVIGALLLATAAWLTCRLTWIAAPGLPTAVPVIAGLWLALYHPNQYWTLQGFETGLVTVWLLWLHIALSEPDLPAAPASVATGSPAKAPDSDSGRSGGTWLTAGWLAIGGLVRPDAILPGVVVWWTMTPPGRRWRGLAVQLAVATALTGWRLATYGEWLPNTWWLKMSGYPPLLRLTRGLSVWGRFAWYLNPLLLVGAWWATRHRNLAGRPDRHDVGSAPLPPWMAARNASFAQCNGAASDPLPTLASLPVPPIDHRVVTSCWRLLLTVSAYSVWVGGDAWDFWGGANRFLAPAMPQLFVLLALALGWATDRFPALRTRSRLVLAIGAVVTAFQVNAFHGPAAWPVWWLLDPPLQTEDQAAAIRRAHQLTELTTASATIAVVWAGTVPYYSGRLAVDLLGKSDPVIARRPARQVDGPLRLTAFIPGHLKWDYEHSIGRLAPDVIDGLWYCPHEAERSLAAYRRIDLPTGPAWFRRGSPHVRWERLPPDG